MQTAELVYKGAWGQTPGGI